MANDHLAQYRRGAQDPLYPHWPFSNVPSAAAKRPLCAALVGSLTSTLRKEPTNTEPMNGVYTLPGKNRRSEVRIGLCWCSECLQVKGEKVSYFTVASSGDRHRLVLARNSLTAS